MPAPAATADDEPVYDAIGNLLNDGAFHWVAGSGTVQVKAVTDFWTGQNLAVSPGNLLWNDSEFSGFHRKAHGEETNFVGVDKIDDTRGCIQHDDGCTRW